ncbi:hypothetical protein NDN01_07565 [Sphingomonas sp. QA11]|uniref:hypothetical protein n=1 Tax=Sphingomonas sp. QA11 TaxID=2950605 RepID=UPI00234A3977|nr:hypothetical protein [Sphingomonas sp. QA11]WCM28755.1 hypothetical protein NDN01_07565 [Sphingomonas sp. QA11]
MRDPLRLNPAAIVTGAGSGICRAVALALAEAGRRAELAGRPREALAGTAVLSATPMLAVPCRAM